MRSYLSKLNNKSHQYPYFRSVIPKDILVHFDGITEFRLSLSSVRKEERQIVCLKLKQITDQLFDEIRDQVRTLSLEDIKEILRVEVRKSILHAHHVKLGTNKWDDQKKQMSLDNIKSREVLFKDKLKHDLKSHYQELDDKLEAILSSLDIELDKNSVSYKTLREQFTDLYVLRYQWINDLIEETGRSDDDFRRDVDEKLGLELFPEIVKTQSSPPSVQVQIGDTIQYPVIENLAPEPSQPYSVDPPLSSLKSSSVSKCIDVFMSEKGDLRERSIQENRSSLNLIIECFGDIPIGTLDREKASLLKSKIKELPKNRSKNPKYREKDFHELVKMKVPSDEAIHTTTINKYLGNLSSFLTWCVNNGYSNTNVFSGMKLRKKSKANTERDKFTEQELKKIFSKKDYLYTTLPYIKKGKYANYWIPLIGVFSGMRANEICSLYLDNVKELRGNLRDKRWCFDIIQEEDRPDKRLKNLSSRRIVPIHQTLLELGFVDFLNLIKKKPLTTDGKKRKRIFEELPYKEGLYSRNISRFWNASYLTRIGVKTKKNGFHSLRHTVVDHLKQKGVEPHYINELMGHSQGNIDLDRYGKGYNPDILFNKCVNKIVYEISHTRKIDFHSLKLDWKKILD